MCKAKFHVQIWRQAKYRNYSNLWQKVLHQTKKAKKKKVTCQKWNVFILHSFVLTSTSLSATLTGFPDSFSVWLPVTWKWQKLKHFQMFMAQNVWLHDCWNKKGGIQNTETSYKAEADYLWHILLASLCMTMWVEIWHTVSFSQPWTTQRIWRLWSPART